MNNATEGATTFTIMAFSIKTLSIIGLFVTVSISDTHHNSNECRHAGVAVFLLLCSVSTATIVVLNVIILSVLVPPGRFK
jgi:hypothetical protein